MIRIPIAPRCWRYILAGILFTALMWWLHPVPGVVSAAITLLLINFFRDPERKIPALPDDILLAPADGKVISVEPSPHPDFAGYNRVSIFMNIFDVHVNRVPVSGTLRATAHHPGLYLKANDPRSPGENERMEFTILTPGGRIMVSLIAGLVARRICSWARPDDQLLRGQRFAMIKLGSRVDLHVASDVRILVEPGCRVKAGLTPIAQFNGKDASSS